MLKREETRTHTIRLDYTPPIYIRLMETQTISIETTHVLRVLSSIVQVVYESYSERRIVVKPKREHSGEEECETKRCVAVKGQRVAIQ